MDINKNVVTTYDIGTINEADFEVLYQAFSMFVAEFNTDQAFYEDWKYLDDTISAMCKAFNRANGTEALSVD